MSLLHVGGEGRVNAGWEARGAGSEAAPPSEGPRARADGGGGSSSGGSGAGLRAFAIYVI